MKHRAFALLLTLLLVAALMAGCQTAQAAQNPAPAEPVLAAADTPAESAAPAQTDPPAADVPAETAPPAASVPTEPAAPAADLPPEPVAPAANIPAETTAPAPNVIGEEEAKALALSHAGFSAQDVTRLRVEPELRDRVPHYDVEFEEGYWEYEYEIHAETGAVLSFEKDDR